MRLSPYKIVEILERENLRTDGNVLLLGLSFKPDTDDVRESPSIRIAQSLLARGANIAAHDPLGIENFKRTLGAAADRIIFVQDWRPHLSGAEVIVVATSWPEYLELATMNLASKVLFDPRRLFADRDTGGAIYLTIGRKFLNSVMPQSLVTMGLTGSLLLHDN